MAVSRQGLVLLGALGGLVALLAIGPMLVPLPPLRDTAPPEQLADSDSRFAQLSDVRIHFKLYSDGPRNMLLLHGLGASTYSWRQMVGPLAALGARVVAFDRPAFGLSSRPVDGEWRGANPYALESQVEQTIALMDRLGMAQAVLVGHSAGARVACSAALRHRERVQALVLESPAIYEEGGYPAWILPLLRLPQLRRIGPLLVRSIARREAALVRRAWHDPSLVTPAILEGYAVPLRVENWDRALWELTLADAPHDLASQLAHIAVPTLVIGGDDDHIVPTASSVRLAGAVPGAELAIVPDCGHIPHEEKPAEFLAAVERLLASLP